MKKLLLLILPAIILAGCINTTTWQVMCLKGNLPEVETAITAKYSAIAKKEIDDMYNTKCIESMSQQNTWNKILPVETNITAPSVGLQ